MKRTAFWSILTAVVLCLSASASAVDLKTYYSRANGKRGADLKTAMYQTISKHKNIGYDGLLEAYHESDRRADGYLRDWYSNATKYVIGGPAENHSYSKEGDGYNREHLVPQSWFGSGDMKSDLVQVVPSDGYVNNRRSNFPLGENKGETYQSINGYCKLGACTYPGYTGKCFEPNDEMKGDIARVYFYVLACYQNLHPNWTSSGASNVFDGRTYPGLKDWTLKMFLKWAKQDPVDDVERARNEVVYAKQNNRNPFVDYPSLCEYVWGDSINYDFDVTLPHGQKDYDPDDNPDDPDNPDNPDNPDTPDTPDTPDNPDATSGTIDFASLTWTSASHPTYGDGFKATVGGLTVSYYTYQSQNAVVTRDGEVRLYKGAVMIIEGAEITKVIFHASDSKLANIKIGNQIYEWNNSSIIWEGSMKPFIVTAEGGQSRIASLDVTIAEKEEPVIDAMLMNAAVPADAEVYDVMGRYVGRQLPLRRGTYIVRCGQRTQKILVR